MLLSVKVVTSDFKKLTISCHGLVQLAPLLFFAEFTCNGPVVMLHAGYHKAWLCCTLICDLNSGAYQNCL